MMNFEWGGLMQKENIIREKSYTFALRIINLCIYLKEHKHFEIGGQLLRAGTSIGANVEEAQAGHSRSEFSYKMSIASREARESNYWLRLLRDAQVLSPSQSESLINESEEILKILASIVKTSKENPN